MSCLRVLAFSVCYCRLNDGHFLNDDVAQKRIKLEPKEESNLVCEPTPAFDLSRGIKEEPNDHVLAAESLLSKFDVHTQIKEEPRDHSSPNTMQCNSSGVSQPNVDNKHYHDSVETANKPSSSASQSKIFLRGFTQEQLSYLVNTITENTESYRRFLTAYYESANVDLSSKDVFKKFFETKMITLRSFTMKKYTTRYVLSIHTKENYDVGKLITDFRAYYHNSNAVPAQEEENRRNTLLKTLYVCYENGQASYNVCDMEKFPLKVYDQISESVADKEKNLQYTKKMFSSITKFPLRIDERLYVNKMFAYNLLVYLSTRLDSDKLTEENYRECFCLELETVFKDLLLPEETDYMHAFIFLAYLQDDKKKKRIFIKNLKSRVYDRAIAFYHFKNLYYIFYNIHRLGPYTKEVFYKTMFDFPDSLAFMGNVIDHFLTNTLYILEYKRNINIKDDDNTKFTLLVYILSYGLKYLNKETSLEENLESLLNDTISLLDLKSF